MRVYLSCADLWSAGLSALCCTSCHTDADEYGYPLLSLNPDPDPEWEVEVCCAVRSAWLTLGDPERAAVLARVKATKEAQHAAAYHDQES